MTKFPVPGSFATVTPAVSSPLGFGFGGPQPQPPPWVSEGQYIQYQGGVVVGQPTGGNEGPGTLNAQGLFINGVSVSATYLPLAGGTLTGPLILSSDPTVSAQAATKNYVDAHTGLANVGASPPSAPNPGALWWDDVGGNLYIWYNDGTSTQWVIAVNPPIPVMPSTGPTPPASPFNGSMWWNPNNGQLYIWYVDPNGGQWVVANNTPVVPGPIDAGTF